ncbi:MAG: DUF3368 domain-containing protein [Okeania sp. SIO3I5]|uniref:DUF3368 domain-containing protein n=1 Tax=Okeania sp. SIO3I5 TaxID=2607805 RepID=UPI0013B838BB|nr:DUF3368 domain-containing protein [Okeania sp. SIO3I5]
MKGFEDFLSYKATSLLIVDERKGRREATKLGIPITGTLGVLLKAKQLGFMSSIKPI